MKFGWINLIGGIIVALMLIPNIIFANKNKETQHNKANKLIVIIEQIGRYGCMALMVLPLFVWSFGFSPLEFLFVYIGANAILLISYYMCWIAYSKKKQMDTALALAIIPTLIFLISGYLLKHWALIAMATVFGISHIYITFLNHKDN